MSKSPKQPVQPPKPVQPPQPIKPAPTTEPLRERKEHIPQPPKK